MKKCSKCRIEKDNTEFWKRNNRKSGVNSECKECAKIRRTKNYKEKNAEIRLLRKEYYKRNREKLCKGQVESQKGNKRFREYQNKYSIRKTKEGDKRYIARKILNLAIKSGMMVRPNNCSICRLQIMVEGHHEDYNKPLDIIWVCKNCHWEIHRKKKGEICK